jgi:hypothetical protein
MENEGDEQLDGKEKSEQLEIEPDQKVPSPDDIKL